MGDIRTVESLQSWHAARSHFMQMLHLTPEIIGYDPHPDYLISRDLKQNAPAAMIPVHHHHAHMAACMAENGLDTPVIGCMLDGTGHGSDGALWGFEILIGDYIGFERVHHLQPICLPGGEAAIRHPWMTGLSLLYGAAEDRSELEAWSAGRFPQYRTHFPIVMAQLCGKLPSPAVSSAGRLFDGISAILNLCTESTYEGEAAVRLSELLEMPGNSADGIPATEKYPFETAGDEWNVAAMIRGVMHDLHDRIPVPAIVRKFHHTLAAMMLEGVREARRKSGIDAVVFSGGVWSNRYLLCVTKEMLQQDGFSVYTHKKVPVGDGGIALGQAVCGLWRWANERVFIGAGESGGGC
jgi:hydrogenase maturation protein HypF